MRLMESSGAGRASGRSAGSWKRAGLKLKDPEGLSREEQLAAVHRISELLRATRFLKMTYVGEIIQVSPKTGASRDILTAACGTAGRGQWKRFDWPRAARALQIPKSTAYALLRASSRSQGYPYYAEVREAILAACGMEEIEPPPLRGPRKSTDRVNERPDTQASPLGIDQTETGEA